MAVITISREFGSGGDEIAHQVGVVLGHRLFSRTLMADVAREQALSDADIVDFSEDSYRARGFIDALLRRSVPVATSTVRATTTTGQEVRVSQRLDEEMAADFVATTIRALAQRGQVVIVGRGGQAILRDQPGVLHVRVIARAEDRLRRIVEVEGLPRDEASRLITERDRALAQYVRRFHGVEWADPLLYHLTLNTSLLSPEAAVELIAAAARRLDTGICPACLNPPPYGSVPARFSAKPWPGAWRSTVLHCCVWREVAHVRRHPSPDRVRGRLPARPRGCLGNLPSRVR